MALPVQSSVLWLYVSWVKNRPAIDSIPYLCYNGIGFILWKVIHGSKTL